MTFWPKINCILTKNLLIQSFCIMQTRSLCFIYPMGKFLEWLVDIFLSHKLDDKQFFPLSLRVKFTQASASINRHAPTGYLWCWYIHNRDHHTVYVPNDTLRVFICICLRHCERNSCHNVKTFLLSSGFPAQIVTHIWWAKTKICSTFAFEFFLKFWGFYWFIQSSFSF